ncbi:hypothetical protein SAMN05444161_7483 [Rhizobiales bacterium GAS191]|jgi:hypothetical protein|nr:hypothetical protein SAMN05519103_06828 [Rhizobiales bacterium GAS113]SED62855.1 hypothetical protein SAMN05519104_3960 [Rhizobiales bacterium GAS188]SEE85879.1 hypothetical protein SAMN05444161_7483 [Rhizobiales bacterium GAS191]
MTAPAIIAPAPENAKAVTMDIPTEHLFFRPKARKIVPAVVDQLAQSISREQY